MRIKSDLEEHRLDRGNYANREATKKHENIANKYAFLIT